MIHADLRSRFVALAACSAGTLLLACSSTDGKTTTKDDPKGDVPDTYLGLTVPKPEEGFQLRSKGNDIPPGQDLEFCEVAEFPGEADQVYWVNSIEFANGKSSHHLIVDAAKDGEAAEAAPAAHEIGDIVPCLSSQSAFGDGFEFVGGAQSPYKAFPYPAGVGRKFHGKQRFVFDYHYLNTTEETVHAQSAVNFHLTKEADVEHIAQIFSFANMTIDTPAGGKGSFTGECAVKNDIKLMELTRHTHRWGQDYKVWYAGGEHDGDLVFQSPDYEHDVDYFYDTALDVKPGEGFRFQCDYENTETHALRFGPNATDEMCILFGLWWSETSNDPPSQDCVMTQIQDDGIARPAEKGSFPVPTAAQVDACKAVTPPGNTSPACNACTCDSCAAVIDGCVNDADCSAILDCVNSTGCSAKGTCVGDCQEAINVHSPGTGPLIQVAECVTSSCTACGPIKG